MSIHLSSLSVHHFMHLQSHSSIYHSICLYIFLPVSQFIPATLPHSLLSFPIHLLPLPPLSQLIPPPLHTNHIATIFAPYRQPLHSSPTTLLSHVLPFRLPLSRVSYFYTLRYHFLLCVSTCVFITHGSCSSCLNVHVISYGFLIASCRA